MAISDGIIAYYTFDNSGTNIINNAEYEMLPYLSTNYLAGKLISGFNTDYQTSNSGAFYTANHENFRMTHDLTFAFWHRPLSNGSVNACLSKYIANSAHNNKEYVINSAIINSSDSWAELYVYSTGDSDDVHLLRSDFNFTGSAQYLATDQWNFIVAGVDYSNKKISLQINNGELLTGEIGAGQNFSTGNSVLWYGDNPNYWLTPKDNPWPPGDQQQYAGQYDSLGIWARLLTQEEKDYLWNDGDGRDPDFSPVISSFSQRRIFFIYD